MRMCTKINDFTFKNELASYLHSLTSLSGKDTSVFHHRHRTGQPTWNDDIYQIPSEYNTSTTFLFFFIILFHFFGRRREFKIIVTVQQGVVKNSFLSGGPKFCTHCQWRLVCLLFFWMNTACDWIFASKKAGFSWKSLLRRKNWHKIFSSFIALMRQKLNFCMRMLSSSHNNA